MTSFDPPRPVVRDIVARALLEDLGTLGDVTSIACIPEDHISVAAFVARAEGVLAGTATASEVYRQVDSGTVVTWHTCDGDPIDEGMRLGEVHGSLRSILAGERVALNFLSHCSGVAALTRRYVRAARGQARIRDTRKTTPGLRALEKAAVRAGGGFNHRDSLSDAILIKDNHLAFVGIARAVERSRARWPGRVIEVECDTLEQVMDARDAGVELVLLDNMTPDEVTQAVKLVEGTARVEISGGVSLETVGALAESGADYISVGALTHSAHAVDIGLDLVSP
jgi:nicotinate-nucleotide pyrophosphorylase (carboxylating)